MMAERRWQLVLTASPLQGHMTPMLHLGTFLHSKGFSITIAHSEFNRPDPSKHPDFTFLPLPDNLSAMADFASAVQFLQTLNDNCSPHFREHLIQMMQKDKESIVIVYDNLMLSVAGDLGLPSIILRTSSASFFPAIKIIPQLHQQGRFPVQVPELHPLRYKDLPFVGLPIQYTLEVINMIVPKTPPSAILWNTLEFLEPSALTQLRDRYQAIRCGRHLLHRTLLSLHITTAGSIANVDEKVSTEIAWGLANSTQPFLWVVRPVGGFWSHCDWNSTLESMFEGVPMLCQPFELDQKVNSRYLSYVWKMGVEVVERGEIEDAIRRVLVCKEGEELKQRAMEIQEKIIILFESIKNGHDMVVSMLVEAGAFLDMDNVGNRLCMPER
ncbi:hypothetical protein L1987_14409 [Smallanthus sonchifolius]|uniref:Uncharacterized protein n=1 Tax=Smallanthus sonchifolius TaxID=185202 RepID=A0ACB9J4R4_9ASTR|nr:hypothetical protein L1987_14409 [Smallanthus sonchifolius]